MSKLFDLSNKVAFITGASSGLGVQFAHALAKQGASLVIMARRLEKLHQVAQEVRDQHQVNVLAVQGDVTQKDQVQAAVEQAVQEYQKIDILVNNAGVARVAPLEKMSLADWKLVQEVNVNGLFLVSKHVGEQMVKQKYGKIVNISSIYGVVGNNFSPAAAYHASKGAVANLTRAMAAEWAKHNITVNAIGPGFFESEMTAGYKENQPFNEFVQAACPIARWGKQGELDGALVYLCTDASSYTTGQVLCVDGGWTAV